MPKPTSTVGRSVGTGGGAAEPDAERDHALDDVPVVGDGAPAHAEVAPPEVRAQRQDERLSVRGRLAFEDRAVAVSHRRVARRDANVVVEAHHDTLRGLREHRTIGRSDAHEVRVRRGSRRQCERRARGERDRAGGALHGSNDHGLR